MKIALTSVPVNDQAHALDFYTHKLGFKKKDDLPMGDYRWLTLISPEGADGVELLLEPLGFPPSVEYYKSLYEAGIPATAFHTSDINAEVARLKDNGVEFRGEIQEVDGSLMTTFDDTSGNIICLVQPSV